MPTKTCAVKVKATAADDPDLKDGQFIALASVFNNIDAVGDVVMPGAFTESLKSWADSGDSISVYWGHQMDDPHKNIGEVLDAKETDEGLQVTAQLDLDNPTANQVYRLVKGRRVRKMSFAYDIDDGAPAERDGKQVYELRKLHVHEVSVVQVPANPLAAIQQVKEAADRQAAAEQAAKAEADTEPKTSGPDTKAGRTISAKNETTLRSAIDRISGAITDIKSIVDALDEDKTSNDGKANPAQPATAEEPDGVKTDTPASRPGPASLRLRTGLEALALEVTSLTE